MPIPVEPPLRICTLGGAEKACIGHETSEVLGLIPASFEVVVYEREKLACETCRPRSSSVSSPSFPRRGRTR